MNDVCFILVAICPSLLSLSFSCRVSCRTLWMSYSTLCSLSIIHLPPPLPCIPPPSHSRPECRLVTPTHTCAYLHVLLSADSLPIPTSAQSFTYVHALLLHLVGWYHTWRGNVLSVLKIHLFHFMHAKP